MNASLGMSGEVTALAKPLGTRRTLIRHLPSMNHHMSFERTFMGKPFLANRATGLITGGSAVTHVLQRFGEVFFKFFFYQINLNVKAFNVRTIAVCIFLNISKYLIKRQCSLSKIVYFLNIMSPSSMSV